MIPADALPLAVPGAPARRRWVRAPAFGPSTDRAGLTAWTVAMAAGTLLGFSTLVALERSLGLALVLLPLLALVCLMATAASPKRLLLALIVLEIPLQIDVNLGYRTYAAVLPAIGGLNVSLTTACLAVLYASWLAEVLARASPPPRGLARLSLPVCAYTAFAALSIHVARDPELSVYEVVLLLQALLLFVYVVHVVKTADDVMLIATLLTAGLAMQGAIMIALRAIGHSVDVATIFARIDANMRVGGTVGSPNVAGGYICLLLPLALGLFQARPGRAVERLAIAAIGLGLVGLVLTFSRGGWLGTIAALGIFFGMAVRRRWVSAKLVVVTLLTALAVLMLFRDPIAARLVQDDAGAAYARVPLMKLAMRVIGDHVFTGVGVNNFGIVARSAYVTPEFGGEWIATVHNKYLLVWAEAGLGALLAFLWFLGATLARGRRVWRGGDRRLAPIALGIAAGVIGNMIHMTVDLYHSRPQVQLLWLVAALVASMIVMIQRDADRQPATARAAAPRRAVPPAHRGTRRP